MRHHHAALKVRHPGPLIKAGKNAARSRWCPAPSRQAAECVRRVCDIPEEQNHIPPTVAN